MDRHELLLDCDPGHDDVVALLLAGRFGQLRAVTTVAGNAPLDATTRNALIACQVFGIDVDVHAGADRPLVMPPDFFPQIHGETGLAGPQLPTLARAPAAGTAVERILAESRRTEGLWLVATGPLTNVALALRADGGLAGRVAGIALMGGGIGFGNVTPAAEYNVWADPEAAAIVLGAGVPLRVCPLDVTHQVLVDRGFVERVGALGGPVATFVADLLSHFAEAYRDVFFADALGPLHDPCAVLAVTHPHLFAFEALHVAVETGTGPGRGATLADRRRVKAGLEANAEVAVGVDADAVLDLVVAAVDAS